MCCLKLAAKVHLFSLCRIWYAIKNILSDNFYILCFYGLQFATNIMLRIDSILTGVDKYLFLNRVIDTKKPQEISFLRLFCVGLPRFELGQTEPKPVVLPLHHSPNFIAFFRNAWQRYYLFTLSSKFYMSFFFWNYYIYGWKTPKIKRFVILL